MEKEFYKNPEKIKKSGCNIDVKANNSLEKFNASNQDFFKLLEGLENHGKVEYKIFKEIQKGPVLVIFREIHNDNILKALNFLAFVDFKQYFNFLSTEGTNQEVITNQDFQLNKSKEKTIDYLLSGYGTFSSMAIKQYFGDELDVCGVDFNNSYLQELKLLSNELQIISKLSKENQEEFLNNEIIKQIIYELKDKKLEINYENIKKFLNNKIIFIRNKIWLENTKNILISRENKNSKNFIPIIVGGDHSEDLSKNAKNYGFRGVMIFTHKNYN